MRVLLFFFSFVCLINCEEILQNCRDYGSKNDTVFILEQNFTIQAAPGLISCILFYNSHNIILDGRNFSIVNDKSNTISYSFHIFSLSSCSNVTFVNFILENGNILITGENIVMDNLKITGRYGAITNYETTTEYTTTIANNLKITNCVFSSFDLIAITLSQADNLFVADSLLIGYQGLGVVSTNAITIKRNNYKSPPNSREAVGFIIGAKNAQNIIIEDNYISFTPNYYGYGIKVEGTSDHVTIRNNFIQTKYNLDEEATSCISTAVGIYVTGATEATLINNTVKDLHPRVKSDQTCISEPIYGGFYISNVGQAIIDKAEISFLPSSIPTFRDQQYGLNWPEYNFGIYIIASSVTISHVYLHDLYAPNKVSYPDRENVPGSRVAGIYIDTLCLVTTIKNVTINGVYGGSPSYIYAPSGQNYLTTGGDAIGIIWKSGDIEIDNVTILNVIGGNGFLVNQPSINCSGGIANFLENSSPGMELRGSLITDNIINGLNCVSPSTGKTYITSCMDSREDTVTNSFINGEVHLMDNIVMNTDIIRHCFSVVYAENVTFYGNGFTISCIGVGCNSFNNMALYIAKAKNVVVNGFKIEETGLLIMVLEKASIINNSFFGTSTSSIAILGYQYSEILSILIVENNVFTGAGFQIRQNDIVAPYSAYLNLTIIKDNIFIGNKPITRVVCTTLYASSNKILSGESGFNFNIDYGEISNNYITGGAGSPLAIVWNTNSPQNRLINNIVENIIAESSSDFIGIQLSGAQTGTFYASGNIIRNVSVNCLINTFGFYIAMSPSFLMENNTVEDFTYFGSTCSQVPIISAFYSILANGDVKSLVARNFRVVGSLSVISLYTQYYGVDISLMGACFDGDLTFDNCIFDNFTDANMNQCDGCWQNSAHIVAGIVSFKSAVVTNSIFSNIKAGNGGKVINPPGSLVTNFGGDVVGILTPGSGATVINTTFSNFRAGSKAETGGDIFPCNLGRVDLQLGLGPAIFTNISTSGFLGSNDCAKIVGCGIYSFSNAFVVISFNITTSYLPPTATACVIIKNSRNIIINGYQRYLSDQKNVTFMEVSDSLGVEIYNVIFDNSTILVENSNVTLHDCLFSGSTSGVRIKGTNAEHFVSISHNTFTGSQAAIISSKTSSINITNNALTDVEIGIQVQDTETFLVQNNTINRSKYSSISVSGGHGHVLDNAIRNSQDFRPFSLQVSGSTNSYFSNNVVSGVTLNVCGDFVGMYLLCNNYQQVTALNNLVEDIMANCLQVVGVTFQGCQVLIDNNIVRRISGTNANNANYIGFNLLGTNGTIDNSVVDGLRGSVMPAQSGISTIGFLIQGSHTLRNITIMNISAADTLSCFGCTESMGQSITGFYFTAGHTSISTLKIDGVRAGNAGNITQTSQVTTNYLSYGGHAVAAWIANIAASVSITNATFINFVAGNGGYYNGATNAFCSGGLATLAFAFCPLCEQNITVMGYLIKDNFQNGYSCLGELANTTTTGQITTGGSSTTGTTTGTTTGGGTTKNCDQNNGGCDPHVLCSIRGNEIVCSDCPTGFNGTGYTKCQPLCGDGTCDAMIGENCVTCRRDCNATFCGVCGDGNCSASIGETCSTCKDDCGVCNTGPSCPSCSSRGKCDPIKGVCICDPQWTGPTCDAQHQPIVVVINVTAPQVIVETPTPGGNTNRFVIGIKEINEVAPGGRVVRSIQVQNINFTLNDTRRGSNIVNEYSSSLENGAHLNIMMWDFKETTQLEYANTTTTFSPNTIKLTIRVQTWPFNSLVNSLAVVFEANDKNYQEEEGQQDNSCVAQDFDSSGNLRWLMVIVNGVSLYGQFLDKAIVDDRIRNVNYSLNADKTVTALLPHFWDFVDMDPHYSVLLGDEKSVEECRISNPDKKLGVNTKVIAIVIPIVVVFVVSVALLVYFRAKIATTWMLRKRNRQQIKSMENYADREEVDMNDIQIEKRRNMEVNTAAGKFVVQM